MNKSTPLTTSRKSRIAACAILAVAGWFAPAFADELLVAPDSPAVYPFAMHSNGNMLTNPEYPVKMLDTGARMSGFDANFLGPRHAPGNDPDKWDWTEFNQMRELRRQYPDLQLELILGYGTAWAEDPKYKKASDTPEVEAKAINQPQAGITIMPVNDPRNLYGSFVYETVKRYKDVTKYWESWGEPDLPSSGYFKGTGKDFFAYQKACYLAAKMADPTCTVLFAGLSYASVEGYMYTHHLKVPSPTPPKVCFFEDYLKECVKDPDAKKNHYYFDVMNQHSYSRASDLYDYQEIDIKLMHDYLGEIKPIWCTEMGIPDLGGCFGCSPQEYSDYLLQTFAWGKLAGVQRFFHFQLDNSNTLGLYMSDFKTPKPALTTYRDVLVKEFADVRLVKQLHGTKGVDFLAGNSAFDPTWKAGYNAFEFQSRDGARRVLMAFADTDKAVDIKLPATKSTATLITRDNQRSEIQAKDGQYDVTLQGATNVAGWPSIKDYKLAVAMGQPEHLVGGATVVIVEK